jgi:hypothetical protein
MQLAEFTIRFTVKVPRRARSEKIRKWGDALLARAVGNLNPTTQQVHVRIWSEPDE